MVDIFAWSTNWLIDKSLQLLLSVIFYTVFPTLGQINTGVYVIIKLIVFTSTLLFVQHVQVGYKDDGQHEEQEAAQ